MPRTAKDSKSQASSDLLPGRSTCWCNQLSNSTEIECSNCRSWIHYLCLGLSFRQLSYVINDDPGLYLCKSCCLSPEVDSIKTKLLDGFPSDEHVYCFDEDWFTVANLTNPPVCQTQDVSHSCVSSNVKEISPSSDSPPLLSKFQELEKAFSTLTLKLESMIAMISTSLHENTADKSPSIPWPAPLPPVSSSQFYTGNFPPLSSIDVPVDRSPGAFQGPALSNHVSNPTPPISTSRMPVFPVRQTGSIPSVPPDSGIYMPNELILTNFPDDKDLSFGISSIIQSIRNSSPSSSCPEPTDVIRIGKPKVNSHRLVRLIFKSAFDAKLFKSAFSSVSPLFCDSSQVRIRSSLSPSGQALRRHCFELNKQASKSDNGSSCESFSLRDSGVIWRFVRRDDGSWQRDSSWFDRTYSKN